MAASSTLTLRGLVGFARAAVTTQWFMWSLSG